jgi:hypothetical protein
MAAKRGTAHGIRCYGSPRSPSIRRLIVSTPRLHSKAPAPASRHGRHPLADALSELDAESRLSPATGLPHRYRRRPLKPTLASTSPTPTIRAAPSVGRAQQRLRAQTPG